MDKLSKQINYLMKTTDETVRKEMLSQMGIEDGNIDLYKYKRSLQVNKAEIMDIDKILKKYYSEVEKDTISDSKDISKSIISGINF